MSSGMCTDISARRLRCRARSRHSCTLAQARANDPANVGSRTAECFFSVVVVVAVLLSLAVIMGFRPPRKASRPGDYAYYSVTAHAGAKRPRVQAPLGWLETQVEGESRQSEGEI